MKFLMVIGKHVLHTYFKEGKRYEIQYLEGSETYPYNRSSANEDILAYMEVLANEKNLGTTAKLEFDVLECSDHFCNTAVLQALEGYVVRKYSFLETLLEVLKKLSRDKKLLISEYGINYDGSSYQNINDRVEKKEFYLLAYTVHSADIVELMDFE